MMSTADRSVEDLPVDITANILSRLHVKTIIYCRCVCKKWWNLVSDAYFANLHLSRSPAGLIIYHQSEKESNGYEAGILKLVEVEDEIDYHRLHHDPVRSLDLKLGAIFHESQLLPVGSVNGLVCLWEYGPHKDNTYICNPITRECMILPRQQYYREQYAIIVYGFGVSSLTRQYKVIRIFQGDADPTSSSRPKLLEGEVYTLGTGHWRSLGHIPYWLRGFHGPFLNGRVHWNVIDKDAPEKICVFDFEDETLQMFPSHPEDRREARTHFQSLAVLKGLLCQSDTYDSTEFVIWVMKDYGIKKSWSKVAVIRESMGPDLDWLLWEPVYLIEALKDGTILMIYYEDQLLAYSPQKNTIEDTNIFDRYLWAMGYVPSFLRLQNFEQENIHVF